MKCCSAANDVVAGLCSPQWVVSHGCKPGAVIRASLEELEFEGDVTITTVGPCPKLEKGPGRVVTMTVTHRNSFVYEPELSGFNSHGVAVIETLCPTDLHKLFSATRNDWVMTMDLQVGECLRTQCGQSTITAIKRREGTHRVYNFEVERTHQYFVGESRVLSHNMQCTPKQAKATLQKVVDKVNEQIAANPEAIVLLPEFFAWIND